MKRVRVNLARASYDIFIGAGILERTGAWLKELGCAGRLVIITNPVVRGLYGESLERSLSADFTVSRLVVPDGEEYKSLETAGGLYLELAGAYAERDTPILALGGGVIGDLAGFVAATYLRGVPLVQIPTTLLAQVDSSIGGKVAVNHVQLKNEIGAFYQPRLVISDVSTLTTLPPKTLAEGLAELIKHAVIKDIKLFGYLEENMARLKAADTTALEEAIARSAEIKAGVVSQDERESGLRAILNYGHTVGHAIESVSNFTVSHGEAVAIGMAVAARLSRAMGFLAQADVARIERLLTKAGLPTRVPDFPVEDMMRAMQHDKKVRQGRVRFVLPKTLGEALVSDEVSLDLVRRILSGGQI